jgi:hypothetical protein
VGFCIFFYQKYAKTPIIRPALAGCKVKIGFQPIFGGFMRDAQQTARAPVARGTAPP